MICKLVYLFFKVIFKTIYIVLLNDYIKIITKMKYTII